MSKKKIIALVCLAVIILGCCLALALAIYDCYDYGNAYAFEKGSKYGELWLRMFFFHLFVAVLQIIIISTSAFGIWYIVNSELKNKDAREREKVLRKEQRKQAKIDKLQRKLNELNN